MRTTQLRVAQGFVVIITATDWTRQALAVTTSTLAEMLKATPGAEPYRLPGLEGSAQDFFLMNARSYQGYGKDVKPSTRPVKPVSEDLGYLKEFGRKRGKKTSVERSFFRRIRHHKMVETFIEGTTALMHFSSANHGEEDMVTKAQDETIREGMLLIRKAFSYLLNRDPLFQSRDNVFIWIAGYAYIMKAGDPMPRFSELEAVVQYGLLSLQAKYSSPARRHTFSHIHELSQILSNRWKVSSISRPAKVTKSWESEILNPQFGLSAEMREYQKFRKIISFDADLMIVLDVFERGGDSRIMSAWLRTLREMCKKDTLNVSAESKTAVVGILHHISQGAIELVPECVRQEAENTINEMYFENQNGERTLSLHMFRLIQHISIKQGLYRALIARIGAMNSLLVPDSRP